MSKNRFSFMWDDYDCIGSIYDSKRDTLYEASHLKCIIDILNEQDRKIKQLGAKLSLIRTAHRLNKQHSEDGLKKHLEELSKEAVIELYLQKCFDTKQELAEKDLEIGVLETALECACEDLQESNSCYINAIDMTSILPVPNAMQIEYEQALSKLGYTLDARENLREEYIKHNFKNILSLTQNERAIEQLEKVKDYFVEEDFDGDDIKTEDRSMTKDVCEVADFIDNQIKQLKGVNHE